MDDKPNNDKDIHKMKTYSAVVSFAFFIAFATSARATTILQSAWQEIALAGGAAALTESSFVTGGVPSDRGGGRGVLIEQVQSPSHPTPDFTAAANAQQSTGFDGEVFQFSGSIDIHLKGNALPFAHARAYHYLDFDITDQSESVTLDLTALSVLPGLDNHLPGFTYDVINRATNQGSGAHFLESPLRQVFTLSPGSYRLEAGLVGSDAIVAPDQEPIVRSASFADTISFTNLSISPGAFQTHPVVAQDGIFTHVLRRDWFDPPTATEFEFQMTDAALFTQIMSLPTGFDAPFEVIAENTSLGFFGTDRSVNFVELLGHGVSAFTVKNITPGVDATSLTAFPIQLDFDTKTASFTMTPVVSTTTTVPDSSTSTVLLLAVAAVPMAVLRRRWKAQSDLT